MAVALANAVKVTGGGTSSTTPAITSTSGSAFVGYWFGDATPNTPTDSKGNTYAQVGTTQSAGGCKLAVFAATGSTTGGSSHTLTWTCDGAGASIVGFFEVSGAASSPIDSASAFGTDASSPFTLTSGTLAQAANLAIAVCGNQGGGDPHTYTEGSGFTASVGETDGNSFWAVASATKITSATTALATTWTESPSSGGATTALAVVVLKEAASGGTSVNPGAGSLTITGHAPSIAQPHAVAPGVGSMVISGHAPAVSQGTSVAPGAGSLTLTGHAPTINQPHAVAPGAGGLTITGFAPSIAQPHSVAPGVGSVVITGYAPTVTQDSGTSVAPGTGALVITGYAPSVSQTGATTPTIEATDISYSPGRKKRRKGEKGPIYYRHVEPEDVERMQRAAQEVAAEPEQPKPQATLRAVSLLKQYGIYREAYAQVLLELEREIRAAQQGQQAVEDDEIMRLMAAAL